MSVLIRYAPSSLTREQYDKVNEILRENGPDGPAPPLQVHVLFGEEPNLRVSEIWESEDAFQQAWDGGVKDALSTVGVELPEPERLPLMELWASGWAGSARARRRGLPGRAPRARRAAGVIRRL